MSSYYDTILKRVESEMEKGDFAEAMKLLEEELSMPYIPKEDEERIITKYNLCRSELRAQEKPRRSAVEDIGDLLRGSIDEQFQAVEQLRKVIFAIMRTRCGKRFMRCAATGSRRF